MHFKSLELIGFKSFAEKTLLNFEPGVTAIVGPNGCGKSNIADSIRWVLGEQSTKSLRASIMEDVIFNGTDTKDPINFAEVSLILSNEKRILPIDYDEVTISRRVFRSGETEYLLNKTQVRLKDIAELLMGTGIGTESYSIIEQGKMDLILSSRPEDRRYVFEEASGITKYKSKKKEALRKLEQTEQNLLRINDIIQEVKRQISSIERQARKAERYKVDFDKLKEMEVKSSAFEFRGLRTHEKTVLVENEDQRERERELDSENKTIQSKISEYRLSLDEINEKAAGLRRNAAGLTSSLDMNVHKIEIDKERIGEASSSQGLLKKEIESIGEKIVNAKALIEKLKEDLASLARERTSKRKLIEEKEVMLANFSKEVDEIEAKVKVSKVQTVDHLSKETRIKNELIKLGADIQNRKARQRRLILEKETVEKESEAAKGALESIIKEFKSCEEKLALLRSAMESKERASEGALLEIKSIEEDIAKQGNERSAIKSKIEFLEDLVRRHEGFKSGVKSLLVKAERDKASFGGILGVAADIIKVERGCEEAVSTFLGDDAQVIIVEKDSDVTRSINYLKENKLGKASFISLERIMKFPTPPLSNAPASSAPLKNFVKTDARFEPVLNWFFRNAYLADSLPASLNELDLSGGATIVTKTGLMCDNGKISGGSYSDTDESQVIGRRDRLETLKSKLKDAEEKIRHLEESRRLKSDMNKALNDEMKSLKEALRQEEILSENIRTKKDSLSAGADKLKEELELVGLELEEINNTVNDLTKRGEALNSELNEIEKERSSVQFFIDESQGLILERRAQKEKLTLEIATLKTESQSFDRDEENTGTNLGSQEAVLSELEDALASKEVLLKESIEKARFLEGEISKLKAEDETISDELKVLEHTLSDIEKGRSDTVDKLSILEIQLKDKEKEVDILRNRIRDLDVKSAEINYKKTNMKERLLGAYKVDIETAQVELDESTDWDALKREILELKERLEKIGPVNLVAIDEHKELEERHAFLVHQEEDLINAKDSLHKAIQKINKTTKDLFIDTFQKIQVEFKNFFRLLFGGGQAELVLIDDTDVLESGIEIILRPPGKKLQNIMLLSGGEKALTAIALLFAIFKVKPSPFCVLDEIDAPLDESNINRFSNVLKDFLKMSQFIIITHNKRTIELADVMYGITMQERGVSKVVSVKFLDRKKEEEEKVSVPQ